VAYEVAATRRHLEGRVIAVRSDDVAMPDGSTATRDVVEHPGAVAVVALDARDRIALVRQYRHPIGQQLWELPAGLLDVPAEEAQAAAARELQEETGWSAASWWVLLDLLTSPGMTDEAIRVYLARDLREVGRAPGLDEEAELELRWCDVDQAVQAVLAGGVRNGPACAGILAVQVARAASFAGLRGANDAWPDRPDRVVAPD